MTTRKKRFIKRVTKKGKRKTLRNKILVGGSDVTLDNIRHMSMEEYADTYAEIKELGQGGFGTVFLATKKNEPFFGKAKNVNNVAIKKINLNIDVVFQHQSINEINITNLFEPNCENNFIVCMYDYFILDDPDTPVLENNGNNGLLCIVMEVVKGKILYDYLLSLSSFKNREIRCIVISNLCKGLMNIHSANVLHKDIKPDNIIYDGYTGIKYIDFGLGCIKNNNDCDNNDGTYAYKYPPYFANGIGKVDDTCDIWSLGITILDILKGQQTIFKANRDQTMEEFLNKIYLNLTEDKEPTSRSLITQYEFENNKKDIEYIKKYSKSFPGETFYYMDLTKLRKLKRFVIESVTTPLSREDQLINKRNGQRSAILEGSRDTLANANTLNKYNHIP